MKLYQRRYIRELAHDILAMSQSSYLSHIEYEDLDLIAIRRDVAIMQMATDIIASCHLQRWRWPWDRHHEIDLGDIGYTAERVSD